VVVYGNTAEKVSKELRRRRTKPRVVYFCPSCDAFQPVPEVLDQSYQSMKALLEHGVGVAFATKGTIPERFIELFEAGERPVSAQVGMASLDQGLTSILEPGAASVAQRIENVRRLRNAGVAVAMRADPMIHGVTDGESEMNRLLEACRDVGVTDVAASYLFLRPAVRAGLRRGVRDRALLRRIFEPYERGERLAMRGGAGALALPARIRREGFGRIERLVSRMGVAVHVCGCKNPDLTDTRCHLAGVQLKESISANDSSLPLLDLSLTGRS